MGSWGGARVCVPTSCTRLSSLWLNSGGKELHSVPSYLRNIHSKPPVDSWNRRQHWPDHCQSKYMFMSLTHKCDAFSILTKHVFHVVAVTFAGWNVTAKLGWISFSLFAFSQIEDSFPLWVLATSQHMFFFFLSWSRELSPFHLKEALYSFSLAYLNCQHHFSCTYSFFFLLL